ncbi:10755_t:CDS:2, partial [Funneliformis mosseae]
MESSENPNIQETTINENKVEITEIITSTTSDSGEESSDKGSPVKISHSDAEENIVVVIKEGETVTDNEVITDEINNTIQIPVLENVTPNPVDNLPAGVSDDDKQDEASNLIVNSTVENKVVENTETISNDEEDFEIKSDGKGNDINSGNIGNHDDISIVFPATNDTEEGSVNMVHHERGNHISTQTIVGQTNVLSEEETRLNDDPNNEENQNIDLQDNANSDISNLSGNKIKQTEKVPFKGYEEIDESNTNDSTDITQPKDFKDYDSDNEHKNKSETTNTSNESIDQENPLPKQKLTETDTFDSENPFNDYQSSFSKPQDARHKIQVVRPVRGFNPDHPSLEPKKTFRDEVFQAQRKPTQNEYDVDYDDPQPENDNTTGRRSTEIKGDDNSGSKSKSKKDNDVDSDGSQRENDNISGSRLAERKGGDNLGSESKSKEEIDVDYDNPQPENDNISGSRSAERKGGDNLGSESKSKEENDVDYDNPQPENDNTTGRRSAEIKDGDEKVIDFDGSKITGRKGDDNSNSESKNQVPFTSSHQHSSNNDGVDTTTERISTERKGGDNSGSGSKSKKENDVYSDGSQRDDDVKTTGRRRLTEGKDGDNSGAESMNQIKPEDVFQVPITSTYQQKSNNDGSDNTTGRSSIRLKDDHNSDSQNNFHGSRRNDETNQRSKNTQSLSQSNLYENREFGYGNLEEDPRQFRENPRKFIDKERYQGPKHEDLHYEKGPMPGGSDKNDGSHSGDKGSGGRLYSNVHMPGEFNSNNKYHSLSEDSNQHQITDNKGKKSDFSLSYVWNNLTGNNNNDENEIKVIFHVHLPKDIEKTGNPVILGDGKELGNWEKPNVKLRQPFPQNPTYWQSEPVIISFSNIEERNDIQYKFAIHIPKSYYHRRDERTVFEGFDNRDN